MRDFEGIASNLDNQDLGANNDYHKNIIEPVLVNVLKDVQVVINDSCVKEVEDCHHDKNVEDVRHLS